MLQGVLFDMDGVLFDTERLYIDIGGEVLREMGFAPQRQTLLSTCGVNHEATGRMLTEALGPAFSYSAYSEKLHARMVAYLAQNGVPQKPGVAELLAFLRQNGLRMAVASSSSLQSIQHHLRQCGIEEYFTAIVSGDMVEHSKPHPAIFTRAAGALGLHAARCAAVEDSYNGVRSAAAAGCTTIMVPDLLPPTEEMHRLAAAVLPSLREVPAFLQKVGTPANP